MAETTPFLDQKKDDITIDEQQTLDDLTVLTDSDASGDNGASDDGNAGEHISVDVTEESRSRTLGTIHAGSQQTEKQILENLAPAASTLADILDLSESEQIRLGLEIDVIETQKVDFEGADSDDRAPERGSGSTPLGVTDGLLVGRGSGRKLGGDGKDEPLAGVDDEDDVEELWAPVTAPVSTTGMAVAVAGTEDVLSPEPASESESELVPEPGNAGPVAVDDAASVIEDDNVTIDVLVNDRDVDGGTLKITSVYLPSGVEGDVTINRDGTISFIPGGSFDALGVGESTDVIITYTIEDGHGGTDTAEVTVTVTGSNDGPVAIAATASVDEDGPAVTGQLIATDIDGDELSYSLVGDDIPGLTINTDGTYSFDPGSSRPRELPPQALTEPYVNLSIHTALLIHHRSRIGTPNVQTIEGNLHVYV